VLFGGDAALGPDNIITAVAHGHEAAVSIDLLCNGKDPSVRPPANTSLLSQKMGIHQWSYDNDISNDLRNPVPHADKSVTLHDINVEVELGFDERLAFNETMRCLNCDVQTVFTGNLCIECDACVDICPTDCITFTDNAEEEQLRQKLLAPADNKEQDLYVSDELKTSRVMVKSEDLCLHCGLCAERCPTNAWDMRKFLFNTAKAGAPCQT
jgi:ferredoxin